MFHGGSSRGTSNASQESIQAGHSMNQGTGVGVIGTLRAKQGRAETVVSSWRSARGREQEERAGEEGRQGLSMQTGLGDAPGCDQNT